tara:strand:- start:872 stop:1099 length:228 start_codon:yes stop_codon:yes gene_type:complete
MENKDIKPFSIQMFANLISTVKNYKYELQQQKKRAISQERISFLQEEILRQDNIVDTLEDNFSVFLNASIDNTQK